MKKNIEKSKEYSNYDLSIIAETLNVLKMSGKTSGLEFRYLDEKKLDYCTVEMNTYHFSRFYNKTHYIDYNERLCKFRVYKKYKGWELCEHELYDKNGRIRRLR